MQVKEKMTELKSDSRKVEAKHQEIVALNVGGKRLELVGS